MSERRAATKGRRLGSSRRKQLRESSGESPAPAPGQEPPGESEIVQRVQQFLSDGDTEQAGVVTRSDVQKFQEEGFPCSREELELVFDGLDVAGTGRLGTEEFTAGLRQFLGSQKAAREHRRRKTASRRVRLVLPTPALEGGDSEERRHFAAFMEQLGTDNVSEEQEIWQLWVKLRQDEPQLLDNLEDFLAKMRHRIQEAKREKEALELTLNKRVAEHDKDVQQLCEVLEQQIQQEQLRLQQQSMARSHQQGEELQRVLDASEREVQRLVTAQMELERRCHSLHSSQQVTSTENLQLQESNQALQQHLQHLHQQLEQTQGHLRTMRATVVWQHVGQPGDRVVAELPIEVPMSPQLSPGKSEKFRSEMRIRLGSQSDESKAKSSHQVVWEVLPAETNLSGAPGKASSAEDDPFPESLKEEGFSDQSSLLREMNDAIAALSKHLKAQAPGAPPALADTPCHPWDNAEPQTGPEAATAHGTTPGVLQETLPGHVHHELLEGDLQEGPATAELRAPDVTQAGASTGAGHCTAQEPGAEQGESPEEAQRMLFLQGKGAGVEEMVLNVAEHLGESMEAGEQVLMEVEGERLQEKTGGKKPQLLGEAEEEEISQGENLETDLGPPEAGQKGVAVGQFLATDELQPGKTLGECVQAPGMVLQEWADPASGLPEKLETELGEHLEPEPPSWGEAQVEAAHGEGVPEAAVAPCPAVLDEECASLEVQPQGETMDSEVLEALPARAECAGSSRAGGEEEEVEEAEPREAEQQLQGECARGGAGWGGNAGTQEPWAAAVPPTHSQEGGEGTDVELMEAQSSTNIKLLAEVQADQQVWNEAGSPGTQQGAGVDPGVQLEKDKPELGLREEMGAAAEHSEGPSPTETPVGSPDLCGLLPVESQALELLEANLQLREGLSPETPEGGKGGRAVQLRENNEEDGAQEQGEHELPHEPVPHTNGVTSEQGEGAGAGQQPGEEAESLDTAGDQSSGANVQLIAEGNELRLTPGGSTEADQQLMGEAGSPGTEQGGSVDAEVQPLDQVDKEDILEMEVEDAQTDLQLCGCLSLGPPWGGEEGERAIQLEEEKDRAQEQSEGELPQEPVLDLQGSGSGQEEGTDEDVRAQEEAESLVTIEDQSTDANMQLIAEGDKLRLTLAGSTEGDLQLVGEAGSPGTEQGRRFDPVVQPLDQVDKEEILEMEVEDAQEDMKFHEGLGPGGAWGGEGERAIQLEEEEDRAQGQLECGLPHEPVLDLQGSGVGQREGTDEDVQAQEEAESLVTIEDQSSGANVQLIAEGDELRLTPGGSTEGHLQLVGEAGFPGAQEGRRMNSEEQSLDQVDKAELVEVEAEDAQADLQLLESLSSGVPRGGEIGTDVQLEEEEDGAQGQVECGLPHKPVLDLQESGIGQGEGTDEDMQAQEEAESLVTIRAQSTDANVQLIAEGNELKSASGESTEADLQPLGEAGSPGTEQGGSVDAEVHPLDQVDKEDVLEMEVEDAQADLQLCGCLSPGAPWGGEAGGRAIQLEEDRAEGQGEGELPHEPVLDLQGSGVGQGEGTDEDMQAQEEAESLVTIEDQSTDANMQLIAEGNELRLTPAGSTEGDLQLVGEAGSPRREEGRRMNSEEQSLDQVDKAELVEVEAEDAQADLQLLDSLSSGVPRGGEIGTDVQLEEEEDGAQGQGEGEMAHEPVLDLQGSGVGQGEGTDGDMQAQEEAKSLVTIEAQSTDANVQLVADGNELKSASGERTEADLQPLGEAGSPGTEQGGNVDAEVQSLDQADKEDVLEMEVEDAQAGLQLCGGLSPGAPWGGEAGGRAIQLEEDRAQGQGEGELPQEPVLDLQGSGVGQGEGTDEDMQAQEEAESLVTIEDQSTDANMQLITEGDELRLTPAGSTEGDLQLVGEAGSPGTEEGRRMNSEVQSLDQVDKAELVEVEAEDAQADLQLLESLSSGVPWGGEIGTDVQLEEEEDGAQGQVECGLPHKPVLDLQESGIGQGEGTDEDMQAQEEAESLVTIEDQSTDANVQLIAEGNELRLTPAGSTEADLQPLGEAGSPGTEQGGSVDAEVQPLDQADKEDILEMEVEDAQEDLQLCGGLSPGLPWGGEEDGRAIQMEDDGAQGQGEQRLPHKPVPHPNGVTSEQGEGAGAGQQPGEEAESLDTAGDQSLGANVQLIAEGNELRLTPGGSTEADLQLMGEAGSPGTEEGGSVDAEVQPLDQSDKEDILEMEVEDAQEDLQLCGSLRPGPPWGGEEGERAIQIEEEEDGAEEQGEGELPHEPVLDLQGSGAGQEEGTDEDEQAQEEAESLVTIEDQSSGANMQLIAEGDKLRLTPAGSTEAHLQLMGEAESPGTEEGRRLDRGVQSLDQVDKEEILKMEAEDVQEDMNFHEGLGPGGPWGGEGERAIQLEEEEDGAEGQVECGLPHEPVLDLQGSGVGQGEGTDENMQAQEEAESLVTIEDQSSRADVQLIAEGNELKSASGESTEVDLQPLGEAGSPGTEQGGNVDSEVQCHDEISKTELVEMEVEDAQADLQLCGGLSPGPPWGGEEGGIAVQIEEEEDGAQGQGEQRLPHQPLPHPNGVTSEQGEGAGAGQQPGEEAESLDTAGDQSSGANVQLIADGNELRLTPGGSTEAELQLVGDAGSPGTEQGRRLDSEVQSLDQVDKEEVLEMEVEDAQADLQLCGCLSPGAPWGGEEGGRAIQLEEDRAQGQGEGELPHEPVLDLQGSGVGQGEGTDEDMQAQEEAESLVTIEDQSTDANVQLIAEGDKLRLTPAGSTEGDLQLVGEAGSPGTEEGRRMNSEVQSLDQVDKAELVEVEAEDAQADLQLLDSLSSGVLWGGEIGTGIHLEEEEDGAQGQVECGLPHKPVLDRQGSGVGQGEGTDEDMQAQEKDESTEADSSWTEQGGSVDPGVQSLDQVDKAELVEVVAEDAQADLCGGLSPGAPREGEGGRAVQREEDEEDGAQEQGEQGLPQDSVLDPSGARGRQGEGAGAGVQPQEEAECLDTLESLSTDADVQPLTEQQEPKSGSGGSTEGDLTPLGVAGIWEGEQSLTLGLEAGLGASPTANSGEGAAAARVSPPAEAALCPEPVTAAEGSGLEAKLGACTGSERQIVEAQELLQGERAPAEGKPLDGAHRLEVAQGERVEAGARYGVKTQGLGLKQGHDDSVPALASSVSEVLLQTSPLKLETMMQEGVLIPDVWRLCAPGQAAQRQLQEQVSAQGHEGTLHTVAPWPEGETPLAMELEHRAAGHAEPPKQEVPPASTLHVTGRPQDAGSDQLGMVLRDNSLGQGQLLGEQSKDLSVGQREKMQEFGQKMSQEGEPSPGEQGAVTAAGAGAPRGCPKAPLDPDHLYNVLFVGDSHVGKTSFLYRLHADTFNPNLAATVGLDYQIKNLVVDNKRFSLRLWDSAGQERYRSMTKQFFRKADGVVLMYDITSEYSFSDVRYWLSCIQEAAEDGVAVLLLGNKTDCAAQRQVPTKEGECLAKEHQLMFYECSAASGHNVFESMVSFVRLLKVREDELKNKAEEVSKAPQKKKSCCW